MEPRAPGVIERRVFVALASMYAVLTLVVLPWAHLPGPQAPRIIAVCNGGIALADLCTALLLGREFRRGGRLPFLLLACAYAYGAAMAIAQALAFPGAVLAARAFGGPQTPAWLFIGWRLGLAATFVATVLYARRPALPLHETARALRRGLLLTLLAVGAVVALGALVDLPLVADGRFTPLNLAAIVAYFAMCAFALYRIWRGGLAKETLYLWLSIVLVASVADQVLATLAGGQYTFGWHLGKASAMVSACVLLVLWLGDLNTREDTTVLRVVSGYGAALVVMLAALVLRWFITPWVGYDVPFATVFGAVAIGVWAGGWRPASLAAVVGFVVSAMLFLDPASVFRASGAANLLGALVYLGSCALIIGLGESLRRARDRYDVAERQFRASQEVSVQGYALFSAVRAIKAGAIRDFRWEYVNPQGAAMARAKPEDLIGRLLLDTVPGALTTGVFNAFVHVAETGEPSDREVRYEEGGVETWVRNLVVKVGDGVSASFFDISETKRLEAELRQRALDLQHADVNKSEFLAVLSHELRNPLAPLLNGLTLLQLQKEPRALAATREMMGRQIQNLRRLIDDLLDVSRIDRGKLELLRECVALAAIVRNAIETAQPGMDAKSQQLVVNIAASPFVEGDPIRLTQIVANLIGNASKFTPVGGRIEVRVGASGERAVIAVQDTGIGFARGDELRMFDMFVQLGGAGTASAGGLGLGLTLARRLAQLHGGSLDAYSAGPGHGAEFVLGLPAALAPAEAATEATPWPGKQAVRRRVLVVDDNADAADSLAQILLLEGFDVRTYYDPARALDAVDEFEPHVAFLDLNMPGMSGIELGRKLRARPWGTSLRLVAVTGMGQAADIEGTRRAGFHAHVTKPASTHRIVALAGEDPDAQAAD